MSVAFVLSHPVPLRFLIPISIHGLNYAVLGNWLLSMLTYYGQYHRLSFQELLWSNIRYTLASCSYLQN